MTPVGGWSSVLQCYDRDGLILATRCIVYQRLQKQHLVISWSLADCETRPLSTRHRNKATRLACMSPLSSIKLTGIVHPSHICTRVCAINCYCRVLTGGIKVSTGKDSGCKVQRHQLCQRYLETVLRYVGKRLDEQWKHFSLVS